MFLFNCKFVRKESEQSEFKTFSKARKFQKFKSNWSLPSDVDADVDGVHSEIGGQENGSIFREVFHVTIVPCDLKKSRKQKQIFNTLK
jgi:hypothetical protein